MTELEMTTEAEVEDFTDELSDEALDRAEGAAAVSAYGGHCRVWAVHELLCWLLTRRRFW